MNITNRLLKFLEQPGPEQLEVEDDVFFEVSVTIYPKGKPTMPFCTKHNKHFQILHDHDPTNIDSVKAAMDCPNCAYEQSCEDDLEDSEHHERAAEIAHELRL